MAVIPTLVKNSPFTRMEGGTAVWRDLFSAAELDTLERQCDALTRDEARLSGNLANPIRVTEVAWVYRRAQTEDLYRRIENTVLRLNAEVFHCDLSGLTTFQYAVYRQDASAYFDWHSDYGRDRHDPGQEPRKLTLSLQLSDGATYDGCALEIRAGYPTDVAPRERGTLVAFRANSLHRVTPITSGTRKSLVMWAAGPEFR